MRVRVPLPAVGTHHVTPAGCSARRLVALPGVSVSLLRYRGGAGAPLVLVHGVASSWRDWKPLLPLLEPHFETLAVTLPGHFEAPPFPPGVRPGVAALADALERELDALGLDAPHLAGSSLGGWVVLELARRGRARTVIALAPAGLSTPAEARHLARVAGRNHRLARVLSPVIALVTRSPLAVRLLFAGSVRDPGRLDREEAAYKLKAFARCPAFRELLADLCAGTAQGLVEVRCPVLIVWGEADRRLPPRQAERFRGAIAGAVVVRLPGAGHLPMWDDPAAVAEQIVDFIGGPVRQAATR